jgi:hypothetical protein
MKKVKAPQKVMMWDDVDRRMRLLRSWDWQCVLCGGYFESIACVTVEHLMPKSRIVDFKEMAAHTLHQNKAPSHYNCNQHRADMSLMDAIYTLARKRRVMGHKGFAEWANKKVPHRIIPPEFMSISTLPARAHPQVPLPGFEFIYKEKR